MPFDTLDIFIIMLKEFLLPVKGLRAKCNS